MFNIQSLYQHYLNYPTICTDTRKIVNGCLFFALKGDKFDANTFAAEAINQGAAYAIIDDKAYKTHERCILVDDVLTTLQDLARHHRNQLIIPVVGLTGSNGKTTTKELIKAVLSQKYITFATSGNLNNHIGVPLSVLSITPETEIAVIEMGANHQKEIEFLCSIAQPTHGLITNIGMAHLDGFGGFEGVKKGKAELFDYLKQQEGFTFVNRNNPYIMEMSQKAGLKQLIYYGTAASNSTETNNTVSGQLLKSDPFIQLLWTNESGSFQTEVHLTGTYNFENILAAICIGQFFEVPATDINMGLSQYQPNNNRSQITKTTTNTVICDFYNANPSSMAAALTNMELLSSIHKTVIIGDMFELGEESLDQHQLIIEQAEKMQINTLIFIGKYFYEAKQMNKGHFFITPAEANAYLTAHPIKNSLVLLKGSRGMALEQLLPLL